jgi:hypothetical protein
MERCGEGVDAVFEQFDGPTEFLRDPSSWLEADQVEKFLMLTEQALVYNRTDAEFPEGVMTALGHQSRDLRSWGVLDSVLRMVQAPKDLYGQPERLLSYFISPAPPIADVRRAAESVAFVLPLSASQYPRTCSYLKAALEALPTYINKPMSTVVWEESRVTISWSEKQASLFNEAQHRDLTLHPELVRNILHNLENSQKQIEQMKRDLMERDEEVRLLRIQVAEENRRATQLIPMSSSAGLSTSQLPGSTERMNQELGKTSDHSAGPFSGHSSGHSSGPLSGPSGVQPDGLISDQKPNQAQIKALLEKLYRLNDYWARGNQLITLLIGQGRASPQVKEAMRRLDWTHIETTAPEIMKNTISSIREFETHS